MAQHHKCVPEGSSQEQFSGYVERRLFAKPPDVEPSATSAINGRPELDPAVFDFRAPRGRAKEHYRSGMPRREIKGAFQGCCERRLMRKVVVAWQDRHDGFIVVLFDAQKT